MNIIFITILILIIIITFLLIVILIKRNIKNKIFGGLGFIDGHSSIFEDESENYNERLVYYRNEKILPPVIKNILNNNIIQKQYSMDGKFKLKLKENYDKLKILFFSKNPIIKFTNIKNYLIFHICSLFLFNVLYKIFLILLLKYLRFSGVYLNSLHHEIYLINISINFIPSLCNSS